MILDRTAEPLSLPRLIVSGLIPFLAFFIQWQFWSTFSPHAWILFYPAVFVSSWIGGMRVGLFATFVSTMLGWYFFISPEMVFFKGRVEPLVVSGVFVVVGIIFSIFHEQRRRATSAALAALDQFRRSEQRYRNLVDLASDGIFVADLNGRYTDVNQAACEMLGYSRDELVGKSIRDLHPPEEISKLLVMKNTLRQPGQVQLGEWKLKKKDGTYLEVEISSKIYPDQRWLKFVRDISERKRIERELESAEIKYKSLFENAIDSIIVVDNLGKIQLVNKQVEDLFGYAPTEIVGKPIEILIPERLRGGHLISRSKYLSSPKPRPMGTRLDLFAQKKDGTEFPIDISLSPVKAVSGVQVIAIMRDVTERNQAETLLRAKEHQLKYFVEHSPVAIAILDNQMRYLFVSERWFTDYSVKINREEIIGKSHYEIFPDVSEQWKEIHKRCLMGHIEKHEADPWHRANGHVAWVHWEVHPWYDAQGKIGGIFIFSENITDRKQAEDALKRTAEQLARSNAELEQFAYVTSHDLREPLRMVTNYAQLLEKRYKGKLDESADKFINYMVEGVNRMDALISDLLAYSRVGKTDMQLEEIDMTELANDVLKNLEAAIRESGAIIKIESLPKTKGNRMLIQQLIQNLLSNAIKFHKTDVSPKIEVSARKEDGEWVYSISDNGIGIEPQYRDRIFIIFQRLHSRAEYPGTGIGLAICKKIVERHGGKIGVESKPGEGSQFYFTLSPRSTMADSNVESDVNKKEGDNEPRRN